MNTDNSFKRTGIKRVIAAFGNTNKGIYWMLKNEAAFRQEAVLLCLLSGVSLFLDVTALERVLLICSVLFVLLIETLNTAIEAVVDRIGFEFHQLSGLAKDLGSAAVFISFIIASLVWGAILCF
ncbi:MAG: diacylglycerol kinase [Psychrobium sp.]|nr:diacylglycerol kinase [Psychrobium sp.]